MPINDNESKISGDIPAVNGGAFSVPDWINSELFENLLKENVKDFKCIGNFKVYPGLQPGENYATMMWRVEIEAELKDGSKQNIFYMLKTAHTSEAYKEFMKDLNIFEVERLMYLDIVPEFERMYREAGQEVKFSANSFDLKINYDNVLLEDLRPRGFKNTNRLDGFDMAHITHALKKLAQWHAASATRVAIKGDYPVKVMNGYLIPEKLKEMEAVFDNMSKPLLTYVDKYQGIDEDFKKIVENAQKNMMAELFKLSATASDEFQVLNHGDCWSNNIMFQYDDDGGVKETYFVDYQLPKFGSPAQDLLYLIVSSGSYDIKVNEFDNLIRIYYEKLKESLELLKYPKKIPLLKEIHMALYKYGMWGFTTASSVMAAVLCDPDATASFDNFIGETEDGTGLKTLMFSNNRYRKHMEMLLPWLRNRGALDVES